MDLITLFKVSATALNIIDSRLTNRKADMALIDLASGKKDVNEIGRDSHEIYRFTLLVESLNKASTYAKANVLKNLYLAFDGDNKSEKDDDFFFEILSILSELSDREIHILYLLEVYYSEHIADRCSDVKYSRYFKDITSEGLGFGGSPSDSFYYFAAEKLGLDSKYLTGLMKRLERSGLIVLKGGDLHAKFPIYVHTELYREIKTRLIMAMEGTYGDVEKITSAQLYS